MCYYISMCLFVGNSVSFMLSCVCLIYSKIVDVIFIIAMEVLIVITGYYMTFYFV